MMTLNEAIKHCEEVAEENEEIYKAHCRIYSKEVVEKYPSPPCKKCAKEHRQLAEWLKELKQLKEQELILDKIRAEIVDTLYVDSLIFGELIDFKNGKISADDVIEEFNRVTRMEVLRIIDKYRAESKEEK